jgi:hypothetical protein
MQYNNIMNGFYINIWEMGTKRADEENDKQSNERW